MPSDNIETWLGWTGLGLGVVIAYAAYKDVNVFGADGIIGSTLKNGIIPQVTKLPKKSSTGKTGILPIIPGLPIPIPVPGSLTPQQPTGTPSNPVRNA